MPVFVFRPVPEAQVAEEIGGEVTQKNSTPAAYMGRAKGVELMGAAKLGFA